jgi:uncharacterized membrane protein YfcA
MLKTIQKGGFMTNGSSRRHKRPRFIIVVLFTIIGLFLALFSFWLGKYDLVDIEDMRYFFLTGIVLIIVSFILLIRFIVYFYYARIIKDESFKIVPEQDVIPEASGLVHTMNELGKNYNILRRQATQGFFLAAVLGTVGLLAILYIIIFKNLCLSSPTTYFAAISSAIVEAVSALGIIFYKATSNKLMNSSNDLHKMWRMFAAIKETGSLPPRNQINIKIALIAALAEIELPPSDRLISVESQDEVSATEGGLTEI